MESTFSFLGFSLRLNSIIPIGRTCNDKPFFSFSNCCFCGFTMIFYQLLLLKDLLMHQVSYPWSFSFPSEFPSHSCFLKIQDMPHFFSLLSCVFFLSDWRTVCYLLQFKKKFIRDDSFSFVGFYRGSCCIGLPQNGRNSLGSGLYLQNCVIFCNGY